MRLSLSVPATNDRGPQYAEMALAAIHQANPHRLPITLELGRAGDELRLSVGGARELRSIVESQLFAAYPDCRLERISEAEPSVGRTVWVRELALHRDLFPCRRWSQFEDTLNRVTADPLTSLLATLPHSRASWIRACIEITVTPAPSSRIRRYRYCLRKLSSPFLRRHHRLAYVYESLALSSHVSLRMLGWLLSRLADEHVTSHTNPLTTSASRAHEREDDLAAASDKMAKQLFATHIRLIVSGPPEADKLARRKLEEMAGAFGVFSLPRLGAFHATRIRRSDRVPPRRHAASILSTEELATLFHAPCESVRAPTLSQVQSREFEPPVTLPRVADHPDLATLGVTAFRGKSERFGILPQDRLRHLAVLGKTGMGKSTLLFNLLVSDIAAGRGVALIDPHGDLAESLLPAIPRSRTNEVILFDAGDTAHPLAFNPLTCPNRESRPLVASAVVSAFKKLFDASWGPRLEYILRYALLAMLEIPGATLLSVLQLLSDMRYRNGVVAQLTDPVVRAYWEQEFPAMGKRLRTEAIAPIQNKLGAFVSSPILRNILCQRESRLDLRKAMDTSKVLIVTISKGRVGEDGSALLGSLLVTSLQIAAMSRADIPLEQRRPFFAYVDEFQNFATGSFATILSEARKFGLALTVANQYLDQVDEQTSAALFGNVGSYLVFQVGATDAEVLATQLAGGITPDDLMALPRYQAYAKLLIDGMPSRPFSMRTVLPSREMDEKRADIIRRASRRRYSTRSAGGASVSHSGVRITHQ